MIIICREKKKKKEGEGKRKKERKDTIVRTLVWNREVVTLALVFRRVRTQERSGICLPVWKIAHMNCFKRTHGRL
jgi:hypothetical protein